MRVLQDLCVPETADALATAALIKHEYLEYDNSYAFARKCTWALADIGTPQALANLEYLAQTSDPDVAAYAQKRLDNWEHELHRKGRGRQHAKQQSLSNRERCMHSRRRATCAPCSASTGLVFADFAHCAEQTNL